MESVPLLVGTYNFESAENIDEYLKELGVGLVLRKVQCVARPTYTITLNIHTKVWTLSSESPFKRKLAVFKESEKFEDETFDCRKCQTTVTTQDEGKVMVLKQICEEGPEVVTTITSNERGFVMDMKSGEFACQIRATRGERRAQRYQQNDEENDIEE